MVTGIFYYSLAHVFTSHSLVTCLPSSQVIKFDCRDLVEDCFTSVLTHFLKRVQPSPTLSDLVTALQSPPVNQSQLVIKIRELASKVCVHNEMYWNIVGSP